MKIREYVNQLDLPVRAVYKLETKYMLKDDNDVCDLVLVLPGSILINSIDGELSVTKDTHDDFHRYLETYKNTYNDYKIGKDIDSAFFKSMHNNIDRMHKCFKDIKELKTIALTARMMIMETKDIVETL